jgi:AbrB family looped-hinge helix DNA binding protein
MVKVRRGRGGGGREYYFVTIPKPIAQALGLEPGKTLEVRVEARGGKQVIVLEPVDGEEG